jgi:inner membrane protein
MTGKTHAAIGAAYGMTLIYQLSLDANAASFILAGCVLGSLLPDIDHPHSHIRRRAGKLGLMMFWVQHRGFMHSLAIAMLVLAVCSFNPMIGLSIGGGYLLHVLTDGMTRTGVPLLWPFTQRRLHVLPSSIRITTGKVADTVIYLLMLIFVIWRAGDLLT